MPYSVLFICPLQPLSILPPTTMATCLEHTSNNFFSGTKKSLVRHIKSHDLTSSILVASSCDLLFVAVYIYFRPSSPCTWCFTCLKCLLIVSVSLFLDTYSSFKSHVEHCFSHFLDPLSLSSSLILPCASTQSVTLKLVVQWLFSLHL